MVHWCLVWSGGRIVSSLITGMWGSWVFFFFSSRRRHTRFDCDWSSDVCSSDLGGRDGRAARQPPQGPSRRCRRLEASRTFLQRARALPGGGPGLCQGSRARAARCRSEEHTSELQSQSNLVCRLLLEKKKTAQML